MFGDRKRMLAAAFVLVSAHPLILTDQVRSEAEDERVQGRFQIGESRGGESSPIRNIRVVSTSETEVEPQVIGDGQVARFLQRGGGGPVIGRYHAPTLMGDPQWFQAQPGVQSFFLSGSPLDETTGALLVQADPALKQQLGLPENQGVVVLRVAPGGPAAEIGLLPNDILIELADRPIAKPEDIRIRLVEEAGDETDSQESESKALGLKVIRSGKPLTLSVRPLKKLVLAPVREVKKSYYIGTPATPIDETLRAHLDLPEGVGLIIGGEVVPESPAAKAGLRKHDILLKLGERELTGVDTLVAAIQATEGKETPIVYLRKGKKEQTLITPEIREEETVTIGQPGLQILQDMPLRLDLKRPAMAVPYLFDPSKSVRLNSHGEPVAGETEISQLRNQIEELKQSLAELKKLLSDKE